MYHFIVNPCARTGKSKNVWETVKAELDKKGVEYKEYLTEYPGHATEIADRICNENDGVKKIVMMGGDGTANEVINGLHPYSEILLGYIPVGSGNDLARGMNLSKDPLVALDRVLNPKRFQAVDHGVLSYYDGTAPRRFAVSSGIGYDADICEEVQRSKLKTFLNKIKLGKLVYILIAVKQIITNKPVDVEILVDGAQKRRVEKMIFAAAMIQKSEGGGLKMAPNADNADGKISVCMVHGVSKLKLAVVMPTILFAKHTKIKGVEIINCKSMEIIAKSGMYLHTDGEVHPKKDHIRFECLPEQIRMYV